jgi:hypothetical protein
VRHGSAATARAAGVIERPIAAAATTTLAIRLFVFVVRFMQPVSVIRPP